MTFNKTSILTALTIVAATTAAGPVWAASTAVKVIKVSLTGEADNAMGITLDATAAPAGKFEFDVTNDAVGTDHEVVLVKLKSKDQKIKVDPKKDRIDETQLKSMGEVAGLTPGASGMLKVKLAAGDYLFLCNHKGHYHQGMYTPFTVTK